jgi:hypothetical protein
MKPILIIGSAPCLEEDLARIPDHGRFDLLAVGLSSVKAYQGCGILYVANNHPENTPAIRCLLPTVKIIGPESNAGIDIVEPFRPPTGSSALTGILAAIRMGYRRIILAGCPLSGDAPAGNPYEEFRAGWVMKRAELLGTVRSLSGWTREFLGAPSEAWLSPEWGDIHEPSRREFLIRMAERYGWKRGAELGIWYGETFFELLRRIPELNMIGVDDWRTNDQVPPHHEDQSVNRRTVHALLPPYANRATIIEKDTLKAAERMRNGSLDFVFIDADHGYDAVVCDIGAWMPKIRRGGFLVGHDYDWESVRCAVNDCLPDASVHEAGSDILWTWRRS